MYRIRCYVSGGVTGSREAWLKASDGSIYETEFLFEAYDRAADLNKRMNANATVAEFTYQVVAFDNKLGVPASEVGN